MQTDPPCVMSVDNASVKGMDFSELIINDPDLWFVHWTEGKGELERQEIIDGSGDGDNNLNGLRENFIDVTPYVPLFRQFLERMKAKALLLDQAKKVQVELIMELFNSKRQAPYHYIIAAGDYWWDASDGTMYSATIPAIQNTVAKLNEVIGRLNGLVPSINSSDASIIAQSNSLVGAINANIVGPANNAFATIEQIHNNIDAYVVGPGNNVIGYINGVIVASMNGSLMKGLLTFPVGESMVNDYAARPGLASAVPGCVDGFNYIGDNPYACSYLSASFSPPAISWSNIGNVTTTNVQWIPIGSSTPVPVTPAESAAILQGITERTNQLNAIKNQKITEVNALTDVDDVIAYEVLEDWPETPLPPGYKAALTYSGSSSVAIIGTPQAPGGGGVPEAPSNGITYGRRNQIWNPVLALSGDVLDGGNF